MPTLDCPVETARDRARDRARNRDGSALSGQLSNSAEVGKCGRLEVGKRASTKASKLASTEE